MPIPTYQELEISSGYPQAKQVEDKIITAAEALGYGEEDIFALRLSLEEVLTNAIRHGNRQDERKKINIRFYATKEQVDIYVADEGSGFDPMAVRDPTSNENLECPNGRGIMLMRAYMNLVEYNEVGNVVHLVKLNEKASQRSSITI